MGATVSTPIVYDDRQPPDAVLRPMLEDYGSIALALTAYGLDGCHTARLRPSRSSHLSASASYVNDGNSSTWWAPDAAALDAWWAVNLLAPTALENATLTWSTTVPSTAVLETSADGDQWSDTWDVGGASSVALDGAHASYVRLRLPGAWPTGVALAEVALCGATLPAPPLLPPSPPPLPPPPLPPLSPPSPSHPSGRSNRVPWVRTPVGKTVVIAGAFLPFILGLMVCCPIALYVRKRRREQRHARTGAAELAVAERASGMAAREAKRRHLDAIAPLEVAGEAAASA